MKVGTAVVMVLMVGGMMGCKEMTTCGTKAMPGEPAAATRPQVAHALPVEVMEKEYLYEVVRYLYRWHLSEEEVEKLARERTTVFLVREVPMKRDEGDRSVEAEVVLPQVGIKVGVKKADYIIEETGAEVKNDGYKVIGVRRGAAGLNGVGKYARVEVGTQEMIDHLFKTRGQRDFAGAEVIEKMRAAVRREAVKEKVMPEKVEAMPVVHVAALSPVANETWAYWEAGRKLFYISSERDLTQGGTWDAGALRVRIFDLDEQVVLSHEEAPGNNRYLTRFEASRAIFNCVVLGERVVLPAYREK